MIVDYRYDFTTTSGGAASDTFSVVPGRLIGVETDLDGMDNGCITTITCQNTPLGSVKTLLTLTSVETATHYDIRTAGTKQDGSASGDFAPPYVVGDLKIAITSGGNAKTGAIVVYIEPF